MNYRVRLAMGVLTVITACKAKTADKGSGSAAVVSAGSGSALGSATGSGSGVGSSAAVAPIDDGLAPAQRTRQVLEKQVELVKAGDNAGLRAMFEPDAVVLIPEPASDINEIDFANRFAALAKPKDLKIAEVTSGDAPGAIWLTADLTFTASGKKMTTRVVELLDGAKGWKIATASIAPVRPLTRPPLTDSYPIPAPTEPGPLAKQLGAPKDLATAITGSGLDEDGAPDIFVVGWEPGAGKGGFANAVVLAGGLAKQGVTAEPKVRPHEVKTAAWSYAIADLLVGSGDDAAHATGLAIAIPDAKNPGKWLTVGASFNAL